MKPSSVIRSRSVAAWWLSCAIVLCGGCATAASDGDTGRTIVDGKDFSMRPGDRVTLPDRSKLRYVDVVTDSRCPPEVRCVWAGDAEVAFTRTVDDAAAQSFSLHTGRGARSQDFGGRRLTLVSLARGPQPQAELRLEPAR
jgi:hypothetical protein